MIALIGLLTGLGTFLVWWSFWPMTTRQRKPKTTSPTLALLQQAGVERVSPSLFYAMSVMSGVIIALLTLAATGLYNLALLLFLVGVLIPRLVIGWRANKRQSQIRELWPDVVDHLRSAIRAGLSLPEALMQLQYRGPEPLRPAFEVFSRDYRASGEFVPSLNRLKDRLSDPTADNIIEALKVTREVGGTDLGRLLGTLSEFLRESARTRSELEARQSWTVNAARLASFAPWLILCLMATQPGTVQIYNSFAGFMVMLGGLVVTIFAYVLMLKLGALPQEKRVLA